MNGVHMSLVRTVLNTVTMFLAAVAFFVCIGITATLHAPPAVAQTAATAPVCGPAAIKGTFSFLTTGFGTMPPQVLLPTPVGVNGVTIDDGTGVQHPTSLLPLHAIGHTKFTLDGSQAKSVGYIHENVGGTLEGPVPFEGKVYDFQSGPHGEGCWATWELLDRHYLPIFVNEPAHLFRIAIGKDRFEFMTFGGGPAPATLSGFATKTQF